MIVDFDVIVVGGGPAGLAAGIGFAQQQCSTLLIEKQTWPIDKTCGEGIMPAGVAELARLGVFPLLSDQGYPFDGIEIISSHGKRAKAVFAKGRGLGVRRTTLSSALYNKALGEKFLTVLNGHVENIQEGRDGVVVNTSTGALKCRLLVAADGLRSPLRASLNAKIESKLKRYGANVHYKIKPWRTFVEVYFSNGLEAYVTPCTNDSIGLAFLWHYDRFKPRAGRDHLIDDCLLRFPSLRERLKSCEKISETQSIGPLRQRVSQTVHGRTVLIGDAGGYFDAITGEGISLALIESRMLVESVAADLREQRDAGTGLQRFAREQKKLRRPRNLKTQLTLWAARHPWLQLPVFAILQKKPNWLQFFLS